MIINHNIAALNTHRQLSTNNAATGKSIEKLSSGLRINRAGDDAAGLAISEKMRGQIRGLDQASRNAQDGISMIQTAEGALSETHSILQRMRELATQAANDTNATQDRDEIQKEMNQLTSEINRIGNTTEFNTKKLLNGGTGTKATGNLTTTTTPYAATGTVKGAVSNLVTTTESLKAGTVDLTAVKTVKSSTLAANAGTIGSPLTQVTASTGAGTASINKAETTVGTATEAAVYTFELKTNFTAGDAITIGGKTFTASADGLGANEFKVGADNVETTANLLAKLQADTGVGGVSENHTVTAGSPSWTGDTNSITITANAVGVATAAERAAFTTGLTVNQTAPVKGAYKFEIATNFEVGQKININGQEFEVRDAAGTTDGTGFKVGADINETATNLLAAINANTTLSGKFDAAILSDTTLFGTDDDTIILTEKVASGGTMADVVGSSIGVTNRAEVKGEYSFDVNKNFSAGDSVEIGGTTYTAGTDFAVGTDISTTIDNLVIKVNADTGNKFTLSKGSSEFFTNNRVTLTEKVASGTDLSSVTAGNVNSVKGKFEFIISDNLGNGDALQFDGIKLLAGGTNVSAGRNGDFAVGATAAATAENIAKAITDATNTSSQELQDLKAKYTVTADTSGKLTFTEKVASGTNLVNNATNLSIGRLDSAPVKQSYEITAKALDAGSKVTIGGAEITLANKGTAAMVAQELKNQIDNASSTSSTELQALKAKYDVTVAGDKVTLTQKVAGTETPLADATFDTTEYKGADANLQIGANTGQSMRFNVADMRSNALKISGDSTESGGKVTSKDGVVASYVSKANVTSGSNDVEVEFALDVSTSEKASAAISVLNDAIGAVSSERSKLGAFQNRLEHTINNLNTSSENLTAAESRIRDVDMAKEIMNQTKNSILAQAAQAMLAQANQQPQGVLQLLR